MAKKKKKKKARSLPTKIRGKKGGPLSLRIFKNVLNILPNEMIQERKENIEKKEIKLSLFADNMIINVDYPKELIQYLWNIIIGVQSKVSDTILT